MTSRRQADEMFAAVDALLEQATPLPKPAERERLRREAKLSRTDISRALGVAPTTVAGWETGRTEPQGERRAAYGRLLDGLAERFPAPADAQDGELARNPDTVDSRAEEAAEPPLTAPVSEPATTGMQPAPDNRGSRVHPDADPRSGEPDPQQSVPEPAPVPHAAGGSGPPRSRRTADRPQPAAPPGPSTTGRPQPTAPASQRFPAGPLAVLDRGTAHLADGRTVDCPAGTVSDLVSWALAAGLGQERLHRWGRDADPLLVLTTEATTRLGLPERLADRRGLRLPDDHPVVRELTTAGWQLTRRGFGPWPRIYRPLPESGGHRQCVQLALLPWDAVDARTWGETTTDLPPGELARTLGTYAHRVLTPRGSAAVNGLELMTALRPPTRARRTEPGGWTSAPVPGSLTAPVEPAPPEAPGEHPVAADRAEADVLDEEAYDWIRDPQTLTDTECEAPWAVGLDVNLAFAAAANRLTLGLGPAVHTDGPAFDKKIPGCWQADLSHIDLDPRLPSPFTPTGARPEGPGWYATPTLAYAEELGHTVRPLQAWLRPDAGPYLDPWYTRLRDAYLATMADLGITTDLTEDQFLTAMDHHQQTDPATAAILAAIKATVKGGIGKLRERPQGSGYRPGQRWPALERPTWRPDIRAAVIAQARTNMHRKMRRMAEQTGLFPLAVLSDCVVYPAPGPSPLDLLPRTSEGRPLPGVFRLGVSPGMVKREGARPFLWAAELLDQGANPARHIKGGTNDSTEGVGE